MIRKTRNGLNESLSLSEVNQEDIKIEDNFCFIGPIRFPGESLIEYIPRVGLFVIAASSLLTGVVWWVVLSVKDIIYTLLL